jgi:hypothetical protein
VLEPVMRLGFDVPSECVDDVLKALAGRANHHFPLKAAATHFERRVLRCEALQPVREPLRVSWRLR